MFKNSLIRKIFCFFGSLIISLNSFAWGPWAKGMDLREKWFPEIAKQKTYKDPLLPFIYPNAQITSSQFHTLLDNLSDEQRKELWKAIKSTKVDPSPKITTEDLEKELIWASSHWATYPFKSNNVNYHELVKWVAKEADIHNAECESATTFQLERRIMEKVFAKLWDTLTIEQKEKILKESGLAPNNAAAYASLSATAFLSSIGIASAVMGFGFYIIAAKTVVVAAAATLGAGAATTISAVSLLCGTIGWTIAAVSAVTGALLLGRPNAMKTASFIIALHSIKATAMTKSGMNISEYILK